jgi:hypothetical protein
MFTPSEVVIPRPLAEDNADGVHCGEFSPTIQPCCIYVLLRNVCGRMLVPVAVAALSPFAAALRQHIESARLQFTFETDPLWP